MKAVIIMGSTSDEPHAKKITDKLDEYGINWEQHAASAHKQPLKVLEILTANKDEKNIRRLRTDSECETVWRCSIRNYRDKRNKNRLDKKPVLS